MASFQAKIGWKRQKSEKIKIIIPFRSYQKGQRKFQSNSKRFKKLKKKIPLWHNFKPKQFGKG